MSKSNEPQTGASNPNFPQAKRKTSVGRVVLVASLALNLAIVGLVIGAAVNGERRVVQKDAGQGARSMQTREFGLGPFIGALDSEGRRNVGKSFLSRAGAHDEARDGVRQTFETTLGLLRAEPFDAELFQQSLLAQQKQLADRQQIGTEILSEFLVSMTPDERLSYAERLDEMLKRPKGGRDDGRGRDQLRRNGDELPNPPPPNPPVE